MGFAKAVGRCYARTFNFKDRASRAEFWWFFLFQYLVLAGVIGGVVVVAWSDPLFQQALRGSDAAFEAWADWFFKDIPYLLYALPVFLLWSFVTWIATLAAAVRRFHDTNRSGNYILIPLLLNLIDRGATVSLSQTQPDTLELVQLVITVVYLATLLLFLVWLCQRGTDGDNRFGPAPTGMSRRGDVPAQGNGSARRAAKTHGRAEIRQHFDQRGRRGTSQS